MEDLQVPINRIASEELEQVSDFGTEIDEGGFYAAVGNAPLAFDIQSVFEGLKISAPASVALYKRFRVWLVPHRLSIIRRSGLAEPVSVGLEVNYEDHGSTCSVAGLLPAFQFVKHGSLLVSGEMRGSGEVNLDQDGVPQPSGPVTDLAGLRFQATGGAALSLRFEATVVTPIISAVGVGSTHAEWRFDKQAEPLFGRDIETWALVVLPKRQTELDYRVRFYFTTRTFFLPTRRESDWTGLKCRLA